MAEMGIPPLTSVDYNYEEYGRKLIDTATALAEGRKVGRLRMVTPTLVDVYKRQYVMDKMQYGKLFLNNVEITVIGIVGIVIFSSLTAYKLV